MLLLCTAVSLDGFVAGFAMGLKKIKCKLGFYGWVFAVCFVLCLAANYFGSLISYETSFHQEEVISGVILVILGLYSLWDGKKGVGELADVPREMNGLQSSALILGLAVDSSIASFSMGITGFSLWVPLWMGLLQIGLYKAGNMVGRNQRIYRLLESFWYIPGLILLGLGVTHLW